MLRPKDVIDALGISAPTLRVWSTQFAPVLSPSAQPAKTETGGSAQRRYTEQDVAYFRRAKELLDSGSTFEQALATLQEEGPPPVATERAVSVVPPQPPSEVTLYQALSRQEEQLRAIQESHKTIQRQLTGLVGLVEQMAKQPAPATYDERFDELDKRLGFLLERNPVGPQEPKRRPFLEDPIGWLLGR